jgi:hypothetical protein
MAFLNDEAYDSGLDWIDANGSRLDICSAEPASYAQVGTYTLGYKDGISIAAPSARVAGGREVVISAIADGAVTATGTATHWAISNGSDTLVAAYELSSSQGVTAENVFTLTEFAIGIPAPA